MEATNENTRICKTHPFATAILATCGFALIIAGCGKLNPAKARPQDINYGSGLVAVDKGIAVLRAYAQTNGHFPPDDVNLVDLDDESISPDTASSLLYTGNKSLTLDSNKRTILLKFVHPTPMKSGGVGYYCGLLSGEVVLLPEKEAIAGNVAPAPVQKQKEAASRIGAFVGNFEEEKRLRELMSNNGVVIDLSGSVVYDLYVPASNATTAIRVLRTNELVLNKRVRLLTNSEPLTAPK